MGVVHQSTGLLVHGELVEVGLSRRNSPLGQALHAVHATRPGNEQAVPVDHGFLGQIIGDENADPVPLHPLQGGSGSRAVVAPGPDRHAVGHVPGNLLDRQFKDLDTVHHVPGGRGAVGGDYRRIGPIVWIGRVPLLRKGCAGETQKRDQEKSIHDSVQVDRQKPITPGEAVPVAGPITELPGALSQRCPLLHPRLVVHSQALGDPVDEVEVGAEKARRADLLV